MDVGGAIQGKIDAPLREALARSDAGEKLRVVVVLTPHAEAGDAQMDRDAAGGRDARVRERAAAIERVHGPLKAQLRDLGLELRGGALGRLLVVDGAAGDLVKALALPGVASAALDAPLAAPAREK